MFPRTWTARRPLARSDRPAPAGPACAPRSPIASRCLGSAGFTASTEPRDSRRAFPAVVPISKREAWRIVRACAPGTIRGAHLRGVRSRGQRTEPIRSHPAQSARGARCGRERARCGRPRRRSAGQRPRTGGSPSSRGAWPRPAGRTRTETARPPRQAPGRAAVARHAGVRDGGPGGADRGSFPDGRAPRRGHDEGAPDGLSTRGPRSSAMSSAVSPPPHPRSLQGVGALPVEPSRTSAQTGEQP